MIYTCTNKTESVLCVMLNLLRHEYSPHLITHALRTETVLQIARILLSEGVASVQRVRLRNRLKEN